MNNIFLIQKIRKCLVNYINFSKDFINNEDFIKTMGRYLTEEEFENLAEKIAEIHFEKISKKKNEFSKESYIVFRKFENLNHTPKNVFIMLQELLDLDFKVRNQITNDIIDFSSNILIEEVDLPIDFKELQLAFQLSEHELEILILLVCFKYCSTFERMFEHACPASRNDFREYHSIYAKFLNTEELIITKSLKKCSMLIKGGLVQKNRYGYEVNDDISIQIIEGGTNSLIKKYFKKSECEDVLNLNQFQINQSKLDTVLSILKSNTPCNILFYGLPGTGKSELAKTYSKLTGKELYSINIINSDDSEGETARKASLMASQVYPYLQNSIIVVDECDSMINTRSNFFFQTGGKTDEKAWINEYFDENKRQMIWITNSIKSIDESLIRRFDFTLEFNELSSVQRQTILNSLVLKKGENFLNSNDIKSISINSKFTSGHFAKALEVIGNINESNEEKRKHFFNILDGYQTLLSGSPLNLKKINQKYSLEGLNIDLDLNRVINISKTLVDRMNSDSSLDLNLSILLFGPPGTGKTEFAKYLSEELGKELLVKRASDLMSKYLGDSEKQIKQAFLEAQTKKQILFIDEADSLFHKRENATRSWEVSQVNELLTCMENFKGILICATNFLDNIDMAAQRRFLCKLKFDYLKSEGINHFYNKFFTEFNLGELNSDELKSLSSIKGLTPGDFNNLKMKLQFNEPKTNAEIIRELEAEVGYKAVLFKPKIGL